MRKMVLAAFVGGMLCGSADATNILQLTLTDPVQALSAAGGTLAFNAAVSAPGSNVGDVFLTGFGFSGANPLVVSVDSAHDNFPHSLSAGCSYSDLAFTVDVAANSAPGTYIGFFYVQGGDVEGDQNTLAEQFFSVTVNASPAPEPLSYAMMIIGFGLLGAAMRRRQVAVSFA